MYFFRRGGVGAGKARVQELYSQRAAFKGRGL
jgi:hypothetical protein